jgi:glutamyl-tRNA reductase
MCANPAKSRGAEVPNLWHDGAQQPKPNRLSDPMNTPTLFLVGATHRTAPFGFREKLALGQEAEAGLAQELSALGALREFVILNTCNRVEIYGLAEQEGIADQVAAAFCSRQHVNPAEFGRFGFTLRDRDMVQHLMDVASGLDSQILGETEIFGQVKRAYATAQARGSVGSVLNRLFQKAFQAAKQVRSTTAITEGQVSVANVGVDLALSIFGDLSGSKVLLVGAGEMGEKSAKAFLSRGARQLTVASRHFERASELAREVGGAAVAFEDREKALAEADIVVCSTAAPTTVLSTAAIREAMKARSARPLFLVDLAMPRDIETAAASLENVFLYNLDDLAAVAEKNRLARLAEAERCREVLAPRTDALWR